MKQVTYDLDAVASLIKDGKRLLIAADEALLKALPAGEWLGGTIPYFIGEQGGFTSRDRLLVTELSDDVVAMDVRHYEADALAQVYVDGPDNGFSFLVIPAMSPAHASFAINAPHYEGVASKPLLGWIAGVHLDDLGHTSAKVFDGKGRSYEDGGVVAHVSLAAGKVAEVHILNLFTQGEGDLIEFPEDGFTVTEAKINGVKRPFAAYLKETGVDTKLPLVADFGGAMVNTSFQGVDEAAGKVSFYAPVFAGMEYRVAGLAGDYVSGFNEAMAHTSDQGVVFSCNCILNFLYAGLEGKRTGDITGPVTFGEIAYQLLNQTLVYLTVSDAG